MKICFISREYINSHRRGGIATYLFEVASALVRAGHEVTIIKASDNWFRKSDYYFHGARLIELPYSDFFVVKKSRSLTRVLSKLCSLVMYDSYRKRVSKEFHTLNQACGIDIVEYSEYGAEALYLNLAVGKTKSVCRFHGPSALRRIEGRIVIDNLKHYNEFRTALRADAISWCSHSMRDLVISTEGIGDLRGKKETVIHNGINISESPGQGLLNSDIKLFYAGTITESKGCDMLIIACSFLRQRGYNIKLMMAGKLNEDFKKRIFDRLGTKSLDWLDFAGVLPREDLMKLYALSSLNIFPSRYEPFGLTALEAMSCSSIVLGSSNGGMAEFIDHGVNGFLTRVQSPEILAEEIVTILNLSESKKGEIRFAARRKAKEFSIQETLNKTLEFYSEI